MRKLARQMCPNDATLIYGDDIISVQKHIENHFIYLYSTYPPLRTLNTQLGYDILSANKDILGLG